MHLSLPSLSSLYLSILSSSLSLSSLSLYIQTEPQKSWNDASSHGGHSHHHHDDRDSQSGKEGERIFRLGLAADIGLAAGKAVTGYVSGSTEIIAEAAHSISDVVRFGGFLRFSHFSLSLLSSLSLFFSPLSGDDGGDGGTRRGKRLFGVAGSPKFDLYETDFGWGKPEKFEAVSIDGDGSMSLCKSGEFEGALEIGLSLSKKKTDAFAYNFSSGLKF